MWLCLSFVIRTLFGSKGLALATRQVRWLTFAVRLKELTHGIFDAISIRREPILVELGGSCISRSSPFPYLPPWKQSCQSLARLAERESKSELPESLGYVVEALCRQMWRKNHPDPHGVSLYEETRSLLPRWNEVNLSLLPLGSACC